MNGGTALAPSAHLNQPFFFSCVPLGGHEEPSGPPLDEAKFRRLSIQFSGLFFLILPFKFVDNLSIIRIWTT